MQILRPGVAPPAREGGAAGYDVRAAEPATVPAGGRALVPTGVAVAAPPGTYIRVAPRSGLARDRGVQAGAGVVDADYRGEIHVLLFNHGADDHEVRAGDRVAQLVFERYEAPELEVAGSLPPTARGGAGFGSTGA